MASSAKNKRDVYNALVTLGGTATMGQIAQIVERSVNGVSQTISSIPGLQCGEGRGKDLVIIVPRGHVFKK